MRSYDEIIEVRRGLVAGQEVPAQFIWRDRLWVVQEIVSYWVETGAWWEQSGVAALFGIGDSGSTTVTTACSDLLGEREYWRVDAARGRQVIPGSGVFDVSFDWAQGLWRLVRSID